MANGKTVLWFAVLHAVLALGLLTTRAAGQVLVTPTVKPTPPSGLLSLTTLQARIITTRMSAATWSPTHRHHRRSLDSWR